MTEAEWLACCDYEMAARFATAQLTDRRARLLACAWLPSTARACLYDELEPVWASALETAERFADGLTTLEELEHARMAAASEWADSFGEIGWAGPSFVAHALTYIFTPTALDIAFRGAVKITEEFGSDQSAVLGLQAIMFEFLRDIVGNPFRPVAFNADWWTDNVIALSETAYTERLDPWLHLDPDRLAVLADALEDAGCDAGDLLTHLRGPGPHVRGCWALDLVLAKA